jgi:DNA-directed RNA polymerase specialized sigma24 family protein
MTDRDGDSDPEQPPTAEDVHDQAIASARLYSPRCPAEDVAQDVVERWLRQDPKPIAWRGWVRTVAIRRVNDLMSADRSAREMPFDPDGEAYAALGGAVYGPSGAVIDRLRLASMLGELAPAECRVLVAHLRGLSNNEIATELDYATSASVATILNRAKTRVRDANPHLDLELVAQRMYDV